MITKSRDPVLPSTFQSRENILKKKKFRVSSGINSEFFITKGWNL